MFCFGFETQPCLFKYCLELIAPTAGRLCLTYRKSCPSLPYLLTLEMAPRGGLGTHTYSPLRVLLSLAFPDPWKLFPLAGPNPSCQQEYDMIFMHSFHKLVWSIYCVSDTGLGMRDKAERVLICRYQTIIQYISKYKR